MYKLKNRIFKIISNRQKKKQSMLIDLCKNKYVYFIFGYLFKLFFLASITTYIIKLFILIIDLIKEVSF